MYSEANQEIEDLADLYEADFKKKAKRWRENAIKDIAYQDQAKDFKIYHFNKMKNVEVNAPSKRGLIGDGILLRV